MRLLLRLLALSAALALLAAPTRGQLSTTANQFLRQGAGGLQGTAEANDFFGGALASGDFDGDGFADLAIGIFGQDVGIYNAAGAVQVVYGSRAGLNGDRDQVFTQDTPGVPEEAEGLDLFGNALAALDIDCDGFDDLAIGAPHEDHLGVVQINAGAVSILFGSADGLTSDDARLFTQADWFPREMTEIFDFFGRGLVGVSNGSSSNPVRKLYIGSPGEGITVGSLSNQGAVFGLKSECDRDLVADDVLHQDLPLVAGGAADHEFFGWSLAKGRFDGDGVDDLVIAVSWENFGTIEAAGQVHVIYGSADGEWTGEREDVWHQGVSGIEGDPVAHDELGTSIATGDFDGDGFDDLATGVPGPEDGTGGYGAVSVLYGSAAGLTASGDQLWNQTGDVAGAGELGDQFGYSVAAGDFDGDGAADLGVGVVGEDVGALADAGAFNILYGRPGFGLDLPGNQIFDQDSPGLSSTAAEAGDELGQAMATGDFNGDGRDDLAVSAYREQVGDVANAGIVQVLYGSDGGFLGEVQLTASTPILTVEDLQTVTLTVRRLGPTNLPLTVGHRLVATSPAATLGQDFEYTAGTLSWAAGESGNRTITVRILEDRVPEATEFVRIELHSPSAGTRLISPTNRVIQINDDGIDAFIFADGFESGDTSAWAATVQSP